MSAFDGFIARVRDGLRPAHARARSDDELRFHLDMETDRLVASGVGRGEAMRIARATFGGVQSHREAMDEARVGIGGALVRDIRQAWRGLRRAPRYSLTTLAALTLGFTLAATVAAVVSAYEAHAFPYPRPDRLFHVMYAEPNSPEPRGLPPTMWDALSPSVTDVIATGNDTWYLENPAEAERVLLVTPGFMRGLGVGATVGRTFDAADFQNGGVAMISDRLWRARFDASPAVIGRTLIANRESQGGERVAVRIVGVLPPRFWFGRNSGDAPLDLVVPIPGPTRAYVIRLADGVDPSAIAARLTSAVRASAASVPAGWTAVRLESLPDRYFASSRPVLKLAVIAVALILAAMWANVAVMTLLRLARRETEIAVRLALGAGRRGLASMLVAETMILGGAAGALGIGLAMLVLQVAAPAIEMQLGRASPAGPAAFPVDLRVVAIVAGLVALLGALQAIVALATPWSRRLSDALRSGGRGLSTGRGMTRIRTALIVGEIALAMVLLSAGALATRSAAAIASTSLGFDDRGLVRSRVVLRSGNYADAAAFESFYARATAAIASMTGSAPTFVGMPPFVEPPPIPVESESGRRSTASTTPVSSGFFATLGVPVTTGREFATTDGVGAEPVAIVSASLAHALWPDGTAIGRRLRSTDPMNPGSTSPWLTVVGVSADVRQTYEDRTTQDIFVPLAQSRNFGRFASFYWRGPATAASTQALKAAIARVDPQAIMYDPVSVAEENRRLENARALSSVLAAVAAVAGIVCAFGLFAVVSFATHQRRHETAIRMALGADGHRVVTDFLVSGGAMTSVGLAAGAVGALGMGSLLQHQLYGIGHRDPLSLGLVAGVLGVTALLAIGIPALRAGSSDVARVLRQP